MLRIHQSENSAAAKSYYTQGLSKGDYYSQELPGVWGGKAAGMLGLQGIVQQEDFNSLVENRKPGTNENLTPRTRSDRCPGYD